MQSIETNDTVVDVNISVVKMIAMLICTRINHL